MMPHACTEKNKKYSLMTCCQVPAEKMFISGGCLDIYNNYYWSYLRLQNEPNFIMPFKTIHDFIYNHLLWWIFLFPSLLFILFYNQKYEHNNCDKSSQAPLINSFSIDVFI